MGLRVARAIQPIGVTCVTKDTPDTNRGKNRTKKEMLWEKMTIDFHLRLFLALLVIIGVWTTTQQDMIFQKPADWLTYWLGRKIAMPLFGCYVCMSSGWGLLVWWLTDGPWMPIWQPIFFLLALCGSLKLIAETIFRDV
jgi:hypothetical protein